MALKLVNINCQLNYKISSNNGGHRGGKRARELCWIMDVRAKECFIFDASCMESESLTRSADKKYKPISLNIDIHA